MPTSCYKKLQVIEITTRSEKGITQNAQKEPKQMSLMLCDIEHPRVKDLDWIS